MAPSWAAAAAAAAAGRRTTADHSASRLQRVNEKIDSWHRKKVPFQRRFQAADAAAEDEDDDDDVEEDDEGDDDEEEEEGEGDHAAGDAVEAAANDAA